MSQEAILARYNKNLSILAVVNFVRLLNSFRAWEGTWDGTSRTTSTAQNPDSFALFAGISEVWPVTEERLTSHYLLFISFENELFVSKLEGRR